ncbi:HDIG domain-containing protein [Candidatus Bathyarchaeota archaeon]|nr:HDIG domain-containing protein [Candidatus Bathyarchaeota archaeon]
MIAEDEALQLVRKTSKYDHALVVATLMEKLAATLNENEQEWKLVGLLHDLDYDEVVNEMKRHGIVSAERLKGKLPEHCIHAIMVHDHRTGLTPKSRLDKALIAADTVASLIEKTETQIEKLEVDALRVKLENASLGQSWYKSNLMQVEEIGLRLEDFLHLCLDVLKTTKSTKNSNPRRY